MYLCVVATVWSIKAAVCRRPLRCLRCGSYCWHTLHPSLAYISPAVRVHCTHLMSSIMCMCMEGTTRAKCKGVVSATHKWLPKKLPPEMTSWSHKIATPTRRFSGFQPNQHKPSWPSQTHGTRHDPCPCPQNLDTVQSRTVTVYGRGSIEELADWCSWKVVQRKCIRLLEMYQ